MASRKSHISAVVLFAALCAAAPTSKVATSGSIEVTLDAGFWFGPFNVGNSNNLSLLIDTGSSDMGIDKGKYTPSKTGQKTGRSRTDSYGTTESNGCGTASLTESLYSDTVSAAGISASRFTLGSVTSGSPSDFTFPHDGLVGLASDGSNSDSFFPALCAQNAVAECKFGLALGEAGTGTMVLGTTDQSLISGQLTYGSAQQQWYVTGDVAANGKVISSGASILLDSGTANVIGPISVVQQIYDAVGITGTQSNACGSATLTGTFPCNAPPAGVGFAFSDASGTQPVFFDIAASAMNAGDNGDGTCVATLTGQDFSEGFGGELWIFGQSWFQGKYVDFDVGNSQVGVAMLRNNTATGR